MKRKAINRVIVTASVLISITGCAVGPDYKSPEFVVQQEYVDVVNPQPLERTDTVRWWENFNDPILKSMMCGSPLTHITLLACNGLADLTIAGC